MEDPHLVLLVAEAASLWSQTQLFCCQPVGVVTQAGDGHGRHQDATDAGHGHQCGEHQAGARLDWGRQGQRLPIIPLWQEGQRAERGKEDGITSNVSTQLANEVDVSSYS